MLAAWLALGLPMTSGFVIGLIGVVAMGRVLGRVYATQQ
jgi:hypothetical protein